MLTSCVIFRSAMSVFMSFLKMVWALFKSCCYWNIIIRRGIFIFLNHNLFCNLSARKWFRINLRSIILISNGRRQYLEEEQLTLLEENFIGSVKEMNLKRIQKLGRTNIIFSIRHLLEIRFVILSKLDVVRKKHDNWWSDNLWSMPKPI